MAEKVQAFRAPDGALFESAADCTEHEAMLLWRDRIGEFLNDPLSPYQRGPHAGMTSKIIIAWELFKERKGTPP